MPDTSDPAAAHAQRVVGFVQSTLEPMGDPALVPSMQAYLKTTMPFYGIKKTPFDGAMRPLKKAPYRPLTSAAYDASVRALWALPHREEKYAAVRLARWTQDVSAVEHLALFEHLVRSGGWWDLIDEIAVHLVGRLLQRRRAEVAPVMAHWIRDPDMWIRRAALLAHLKHKGDTDEDVLFDQCRQLLPEQPFFIRKAVGWVLREYSRTAPQRVIDFITNHHDEMSGLTRREAQRILIRSGALEAAP